MIRFEGWRGGAQQRGCVFHFCAHDGDIPAVVTGSFFLLVTALLLFIDDDETEIFERRENCGTRAEPRAALTADPERQRDFRHEDDGSFTARERVLYCAHIHFGFAAAGHSV